MPKDRSEPYRVGMARPNQRYIEPDEIFTEMRRGAPTKIPAQFPFTWNPVNGYTTIGAASTTSASSVIDDIFKVITDEGKEAGRGIIDDGTSRAKSGIEDLIKGGPGKEFFAAVQASAEKGVVRVVKKEAPNLIMLAVAGGAVGGAVSAKLGKLGTILALGVAGWAALQLMNPKVPPPDGT